MPAVFLMNDFDDVGVLLGISVCTNSDLTAKVSTWKPVSFENSGLSVSADGTKIFASIPVNADRGFMVLRSAPHEAQ